MLCVQNLALRSVHRLLVIYSAGFGDGPRADDPKTVSLRKDAKVVVAQVIPGKAHWIGLTVFQSGIVVSDELLKERPVTYQSDQIGKVTGSEREYMLLNESPVESRRNSSVEC